jgi:hypothetical protein
MKPISNDFTNTNVEQFKRARTKRNRLQRTAIQWFSGSLTAALIVSGVSVIKAEAFKSNSVQQNTTKQSGTKFAPYKISQSDSPALTAVKKKLLGTWQLTSWSNKDPQGNVSYPYGKDALGYILYTPDGHMCGTLSTNHRPNFSSGDILGGGTLTDKEKLELVNAVQTYIAYCGTYDVTATTVTHHVKVSLFPNYIGTDQVRRYKFENGELVLTHDPEMMDGKLQTPEIRWVHVVKK